MHKSPSLLKEKQAEFVAYIREPDKNPLPKGIQQQRMEMYRELFFNNVNSFLTSNFPVLHALIEKDHWLDIAQDFFSKHSNKSPYFSEIPEEFLEYLQNERQADPRDPPFMLELAHYEWVEMALSISKDALPPENPAFLENPWDYPLTLSELAWPLAYRFPVYKISMEYQPSEPPENPTFLVVYRNRELNVKFIEITALTYRLLQLLQDEGPLSSEYCLQRLAEETAQSGSEAFEQAGLQILENLADKEIIFPA